MEWMRMLSAGKTRAVGSDKDADDPLDQVESRKEWMIPDDGLLRFCRWVIERIVYTVPITIVLLIMLSIPEFRALGIILAIVAFLSISGVHFAVLFRAGIWSVISYFLIGVSVAFCIAAIKPN